MNKFLQNALSCATGFRVNELKVSMIFLLVASLYAFPLQAEETLKNVHVSLMVENATVRQVLNILERQSEYKFFYGSDQFNIKRRLNVNFHGAMDEALRRVLGAEIVYSISGKHIILRKKLETTSLVAPDREQDDEESVDTMILIPSNDYATNADVKSADIIVSGVVTDDASGALPGVNVLLKGTTIGTT